jgi:hypothetical protein
MVTTHNNAILSGLSCSALTKMENNLQLKNGNTSAYQLWVVAAAYRGAFYLLRRALFKRGAK